MNSYYLALARIHSHTWCDFTRHWYLRKRGKFTLRWIYTWNYAQKVNWVGVTRNANTQVADECIEIELIHFDATKLSTYHWLRCTQMNKISILFVVKFTSKTSFGNYKIQNSWRRWFRLLDFITHRAFTNPHSRLCLISAHWWHRSTASVAKMSCSESGLYDLAMCCVIIPYWNWFQFVGIDGRC